MNILESHSIINPYDKDDTCAKFVIDDIYTPFIMYDVTNVGYRYTFSAWMKSDTIVSITILGEEFQLSSSWNKYTITFVAETNNVHFRFNDNGTYYIYQSQLELGNKATDWTPAVEDTDESIGQAVESANSANNRITIAESVIQQLSNSISMLVTDANGESLMTQTENGWTFSMKETTDAVSTLSNMLDTLQQQETNTQASVNILEQAMNDYGSTLEYVNIITFEDEPCIELGESDSDFKLLITNTRIMFRHGSSTPTYINTTGLVTQNIEVKNEIIQGGYVMMNTADGGWGLLWKGVSS